ncbi:LuxR C-terminal-related transcriptional regulator [Dactylosporangium sp. NPDC005555]|uniref:LuxR C-terminal-related transcriptional regulator n=1 Tax=Dactylosporangium sp. NPDC005555 TaxID=3154889 RepID=UPI0033BB5375
MSDVADGLLRGLTADQRSALRFAALLGDDMHVADLVSVLGCSGERVAELVAAGVAAGVLSAAGERVAFRRASVRSALAEQVPPAIRLGLAAHFAHELARADVADDRVPGLLAEAADPLRTWVFEWLAALPEVRLYAAPTVYVDLLARAMRVAPVDEPRWAPLARRFLLVSLRLGQDHAVVGGTAHVVARTADPGTAVEQAARVGVLGADRVETVLADLLADAERVDGHRTSAIRAHAASFCFERGRWDEALRHIAQLDPAAIDHPAFAELHGMRAVIAYRRDDPEAGDRHLRAAGLQPGEPPTGSHLADAAALRAESLGDPGQALRIRAAHPPGTPALVRLAMTLGDQTTAKAAADTVGDARAAAVCRAMLTRDADRLLSLAEADLADGRRLHSAFALEEAAAVLAAAGDRTAARQRLTEATELYAEQDAAWDVRRAEARLRPWGIRRGTRSAHRSARTGWAALTATELRVSRLVARGLSNLDIARQLMLSRNTVQTHVSNVLAKLGCRSRVELARMVTLNEPAG